MEGTLAVLRLGVLLGNGTVLLTQVYLLSAYL